MHLSTPQLYCYYVAIYFLPCLCVPVKMSVGTETEKFWDSLWELQVECTGLLWVERHPWARGDLGQSARRERTTEGRFGHKQWETSQSECPERKIEMHTRTDTPTLQQSEKGDKKEKEKIYLPVFASAGNSCIALKAQGIALSWRAQSHTNKHSRDANNRKGPKQARDKRISRDNFKNVSQWTAPIMAETSSEIKCQQNLMVSTSLLLEFDAVPCFILLKMLFFVRLWVLFWQNRQSVHLNLDSEIVGLGIL